MCKPIQLCEVSKRLLLILAVACILVPPQTSEAREDWAATVYGASQLRGNIWSTLYSPDSDISLTAGISAGQNREVIAIGEYITRDGETTAISEVQGRINAIPYYADKTTLIVNMDRAIAISDDPSTTLCTTTEVATQGRNVDIHEHKKQDPIKLSLQSVSIRSTFSGADVFGSVA